MTAKHILSAPLISMIIITALVISSIAHAEDWLHVVASTTDVFEARKGTLQHGLLGTSPAVTMLVRIKHADDTFTFARYFVTVEDCGKGYGVVVTNSIQGKFLHQADYVIGGGSIACVIAETMCAVLNKPTTSGMSL